MTTPAERSSHTNTTSRVIVLRQIAIRYHELVDPMQSRDKTGTGEHLPLMPPTWTATVKEFERLMTEMRIDRSHSLIDFHGEDVSIRKLRWHLACWYVDVTVTTRHVPITLKRGRRGPALMRDENDQPILTHPITRSFRCKGARKDLADAGLEWMAENWAQPFEPMLPDQLREKTAA